MSEILLAHAGRQGEPLDAVRIQRDLAISLSEVFSVEAAMPVCLTAAMALTGMDFGTAHLVDPDADDLRLVHAIGLAEEDCKRIEFVPASSHRAQTVLKGKCVYGPPTPEEGVDEVGDLTKLVRAVLPIRHGSRVVANLVLGSFKGEVIAPEIQDSLETLVAQLGAALTRVRILEALRESERRYRSTLLASPDSILLCDLDGTILLCSGGTLRLHGLPGEQHIIGKNMRDIIHPDDVEKLEPDLRTLSEKGLVIVPRLRIVRSDGSMRIAESHACVIRDNNGAPTGFVCVAHDRTEEITANREREALWRYVYCIASSRNLEELNGAIEDATSDLVPWDAFFFAIRRSGRNWFSPVSFTDTIEGTRQRTLNSSHVGDYSRLGPVLDGKPQIINRTQEAALRLEPFGDVNRPSESMLFAPVRSGKGIAGIISVQSYTPNRYGAQEMDLLQRLADAVGPGLERWRAEKRSQVFSSLGLRLGAATTPWEAAMCATEVADELIGWDSCFLDFFEPETGQMHAVLRMDTIDGAHVIVENDHNGASSPSEVLRRVMSEGAQLILRGSHSSCHQLQPFGTDDVSRSLMFVPVRRGSHVLGVLSIQSYKEEAYTGEDLQTLQALADHCTGALERTRAEAAKTRLESELVHSMKMNSMGQLAGRIAHDFNNLLHVVLGFSELALQSLPDDSSAREQIEHIRGAVHRGTALTKDLLAFGRKQHLRTTPVNINDVIAGMERMLVQLLGKGVQLVINTDPLLGRVLADPNQLEMVLMNLAVNARDAMPHGGVLEIATANVDLMRQPPDSGQLPAGKYIRLSVRDTGTGIPEDLLPDIFEPFFTTKEAGKGTGLGLSTVYGIIAQFGGRIAVYSEENKGTQFRIDLPKLPSDSHPDF